MKFYLKAITLYFHLVLVSSLKGLTPNLGGIRRNFLTFSLFAENQERGDLIELITPSGNNQSKPPLNQIKSPLSTLAIILGFGSSVYQNFALGGTSLALLHSMEKESPPLQIALCNGKPTVMEFYADWCESCKEIAPSMRNLEMKYKDRVNFIILNGLKAENVDLVEQFRVDGIPHIAFLTDNAAVQTALVGAVPQEVLQQQISALAKGEKLPFLGFDAFEGRDRRLHTFCGSGSQ